ncbi:hypothetical protein VTL71DRAFT_9622 [Oculimacula yallundae]|uniref:Heterokaryon incompatibility domain-containing protein n=1 Tax=Oculimacula yallundae TaxID=86028 RepID=A0ABR4BS76_9HELO
MSENKPVPFSYAPLDHSQLQVRLIHLQPAPRESAGSDITCSLHFAKLDNPSCTYEALSYEWGDASHGVSPIKLDGQQFFVRKNLFDALEHLRERGTVRVLWIDALCIDQDNEKERNHQVQRMGQIYERASQVIAWLGMPDPTWDPFPLLSEDSARNAFEFAELLYGGNEEDRYYFNSSGKGYNYTEWWAPRNTRGQLALRVECAIWDTDPRWYLLSALCNRTYWTRLWVVQELVLASRIIVRIGDFKLRLEALEHLCAELPKMNDSMPDCYFSGRFSDEAPFLICRQRLERSSDKQSPRHRKHSIFELCSIHREACCTDPLDKCFGLLGMSMNCCQQAIKVDYGLPLPLLSGMIVEHQLRDHTSHDMAHIRPFSTVSRTTLLHCAWSIFRMFQGSNDSTGKVGDETDDLFFSGSDFSDQMNVAVLRTIPIGRLTFLDPVRVADSYRSSIVRSDTDGVETSMDTDSPRVRNGDQVHLTEADTKFPQFIILRPTGQKGELQLMGIGYGYSHHIDRQISPSWLYMDIGMLRKLPMLDSKIIGRHCKDCKQCLESGESSG